MRGNDDEDSDDDRIDDREIKQFRVDKDEGERVNAPQIERRVSQDRQTNKALYFKRLVWGKTIENR